MRLIGMMDSPYVRRVAVSLKLMGLPFEHEPLSVMRQFEAFSAINPVVKAPTLVTDDGVVLMESGLILDYLDRLAPPDPRLTPTDAGDYLRAQRIIGLALVACEKSVQIVYEGLRPEDKRHEPWLERVKGQLNAAYALLDAELAPSGDWTFGDRPMQADITAAVAYGFTRLRHPDLVAANAYPRLAALSARAEATPAFESCPIG